MKIGDRLAVQIEGVNVAEAVVEDIEDGNAVLVIPATRLVVKMRSTLDLNATKEPEVDRVFGGLEESGETTSAAVDEVNTQTSTTTQSPNLVYGSDVGEGLHGRDLDSSAID